MSMKKEQKIVIWKCNKCGIRGSCESKVDPLFEKPLQCPFNYADYKYYVKLELKRDEEKKVENIMDDLN